MTAATAPALSPDYIKPKRISLKAHPKLNEKWVQERIAEDPSILGLGDLVLVKKELQQPSGGRLDLLLADRDGDEHGEERYEVEVQLGGTDPSHIVRTIEYWDIERTRYPDREHVAVLVAEDITSRFLNVISLLNKCVPLIAIQMQAMEVGNHLTLVFTTVVDQFVRTEASDEPQEVVDRSYWEKKSQAGLQLADAYYEFVRGIDTGFERNYNQTYMAIAKEGRNFLSCKPLKNRLRLRIMTKRSIDLDVVIKNAALAVNYKKRGYLFYIEHDAPPTIIQAVKDSIKVVWATAGW
jgi:hypothetical protein